MRYHNIRSYPGSPYVNSSKSRIVIAIAIIGVVALSAYSIWFHMNYVCTAYRTETRQDCDTYHHHDHQGVPTSSTTTCREYQVQVCDKYVPRE